MLAAIIVIASLAILAGTLGLFLAYLVEIVRGR